jgi:hypothetical protein
MAPLNKSQGEGVEVSRYRGIEASEWVLVIVKRVTWKTTKKTDADHFLKAF